MSQGSPVRPRTLGADLFRVAARLLLPRAFWHEYGESLIHATIDQRRSIGRRSLAVPQFWLRESSGLIVTAVREHRSEARESRRHDARSPSENKVRNMWQSILQDVGYALRMMRRTPVVTIIAIVSLALGVAASTSVFGLYHGWMIRSVPYPEGDRLILAWERNDLTSNDLDLTPATYFAWAENERSLEQVMGMSFDTGTLTGSGERPVTVRRGDVTPNLFSVLGVSPILGRTFAPGDGSTVSRPVVIGESLWRDHFGSDPGVLDSLLTLDGVQYPIVGVVAREFDFVQGNVDVWRATSFADQRDDRSQRLMILAGYLEADVTLVQAEADLEVIQDRLRDQFPSQYENKSVRLLTIRQFFPGPADRGFVTLLLGVMLLVLLVACVNVASLYLAKTESRQREFAVRNALGANRWRLVRQLLTESTMLALVAGALGILLAIPGVALLASPMPADLPASLVAPELSGPVITFGITVALLGGFVFGIAPVLQALGQRDHHVLEGSRGGSSSRKRKRIRGAFVVGEIALALAILIGVAALTDLFSRRLNENPGFDGANILTAQVDLRTEDYGTATERGAFARDLEQRLLSTGAIEVASLASTLPRSNFFPGVRFTIDARPPEENQATPRALRVSMTPRYLETMSIELIRGRGIERRDRADTDPVALINQRLAERFFDGQDPIGQRITVDSTSYAIVGIVANVALGRLEGLLTPDPAIYFSLDQRPVDRLVLVARAGGGDPHLLAQSLQESVWAIDGELPVSEILTVDEHVARTLAGPIVVTRLLLAVGALALVLAAIGTYGVMAFTVSQERRETGIRMALGARPANVLGHVTGRGAALAAMGMLAGTPLALLIVHQIGTIVNDSEEFGTTAGQISVSPGPIIVAGLILAAVGLLGSFLPARRATTVDPATVLDVE